MNISRMLLAFSLLMFAGFSFTYDVYVDGIPMGENFEISAGEHTAKLEVVSENLTILNYSVKIHPKNLERFLLKMNISLTDTINVVIPSPSISQEGVIEVPEMICGTYTIFGDVYYTENGMPGVESISKTLQIPCETRQAKLIYFAISKLPWFVVNFVAGRFLGI